MVLVAGLEPARYLYRGILRHLNPQKPQYIVLYNDIIPIYSVHYDRTLMHPKIACRLFS